MSTQWGYKQGAKMAAEMAGEPMARGGKVGQPHIGARMAVRTTPTRVPRSAGLRAPAGLAAAAPPPMMGPAAPAGIGAATGLKNGGKIKVRAHERSRSVKNDQDEDDVAGYAKGGKVKKMADGGKWIAGAIKHPGALHKQLGVPQGQKIPAKKLAAAATKGGVLGKRARLAQTLGKMHKATGGPVRDDAEKNKVDVQIARLGYKNGGKVKAETSKSDEKQDKRMIAAAVHKHERHDHKGEPLTPLKRGGKVKHKNMGGKC